MRKKTYTPEQVDLLRKYYPDGLWDKILPIFPNKSKANIRSIARKHGIQREKDTLSQSDITGQKFNMLTAIERVEGIRPCSWKCVCECGKETIVSIYALVNNQIKSCGCLKNRPSRNGIDLTGQRFGFLTAVERLPRYRNNETFYRCVCDCGAEKIVQSGNLKSGHTRSCGGKVHTKKDFSILNYELDDKIPSYTIYRHISPSGKSYVGITKQNPERRFQNGAGYKTQKAFYRAIKKYGWESFKHEILETGLTEKEAYEKEDYYISEVFHCFAPKGYNSREGGVHARHYITPVIQYYKGEAVNYFEGMNQATKELGIAAATIKKHIGKENEIEGYYFEQLPWILPANVDIELLELENKEHYRIKQIIACIKKAEVLERNKNSAKSINKYTLDGKYVCTFSSITEAAKTIQGCKGEAISAAVNPNRQGETAYGFMWKYDTGNHDDIEPVHYKVQKAVLRIDKNTGEIVQEYKSIAAAARFHKVHARKIVQACNGKDVFPGFIMKYRD